MNNANYKQAALAASRQPNVRYSFEKIGDLDIFFREAGNPSNPAIVLLHGFPASSHMYREVLRGLSDSYYLTSGSGRGRFL